MVPRPRESYPALHIACHDLGVFIAVSIGLGVAIFGVGLVLALRVTAILATTVAFSYFPFATAFILSQHLVSLRMQAAEYRSATPARRQRIEAEVRQYQGMMLRSGLTAPVAGVIGMLRRAAPPAKAEAKG